MRNLVQNKFDDRISDWQSSSSDQEEVKEVNYLKDDHMSDSDQKTEQVKPKESSKTFYTTPMGLKDSSTCKSSPDLIQLSKQHDECLGAA
jgi:hypothetical protein